MYQASALQKHLYTWGIPRIETIVGHNDRSNMEIVAAVSFRYTATH